MKTLMVFVILIGAPLFYLWEHACSFRLCQQVKTFQEQKQRQREVNDSLSARLASLSSRRGIETRALALGLESKAGPRLSSPSPAAVSPGAGNMAATARAAKKTPELRVVTRPKSQKPVLAAASPKPSRMAPVPDSKSQGSKSSKNVKATQSDDIVVQPSKPRKGGM